MQRTQECPFSLGRLHLRLFAFALQIVLLDTPFIRFPLRPVYDESNYSAERLMQQAEGLTCLACLTSALLEQGYALGDQEICFPPEKNEEERKSQGVLLNYFAQYGVRYFCFSPSKHCNSLRNPG